MIRASIKAIFLFLISSTIAFAQTASLLPNAMQTFFDNNGKPLTSGTVTFYIPSTSTLKATWKDAGETILNTNPVVLDAAGRAVIYGSGNYRQVLKDRNGNTIWDKLTSSAGTGGGSSTVGDGQPVGSIKTWAGIAAPSNYLFAYGQQVSRTTYSDLMTAITTVLTVNCTSGSPTLASISDTTQIPVGAKVEASCVPFGTSVISKTSTSVTVNNNATTTVNAQATFFPWGNGNGTTTFTIPDLRGVVLAGRPNMGGTDKGNLTSTYCAVAGLGASCGSDNHAILTAAELPAIKPALTVTDTGHTHTTSADNTPFTAVTVQSGAGASINGANTAASQPQNITSSNAVTGISVAFTSNLGSATPFSIVQPTIQINYVIKVIADVSAAVVPDSMPAETLFGNPTSVSAPPTSITLGTGLSFSGTVLNAEAFAGPAVIHPSSGNVIGVGACGVTGALWSNSNNCINADIITLSSSDPSALFVAVIGGTITPGDTVTLTFTFGSGACAAGCAATATAVGGDTTTTLAGKLACAIANSTNLFNLNGGSCTAGVITPPATGYGGYATGKQIGYVVSSNTTAVSLDFDSTVPLKVVATTSGGATETLTITNPSSCGTTCTIPLDNNPTIVLARLPSGAGTATAPAAGSVISNLQFSGATSADATRLGIQYGILSVKVLNSTVGALSSRFEFYTPDINGNFNQAIYMGAGLYTSGVTDKGVDTIDAKQLWVNSTEELVVSSSNFNIIAGTGHNIQLVPNDTVTVVQVGTGVALRVQSDVAQVASMVWLDSALRWELYKPASSTDLRLYDGTTDRVIFKNGGIVQIVTGGLTVGDTGSPATGIISAATGYRIGNAAATSGHVLRGNGTNYIDGQLSCSDLSTACLTTLTVGTTTITSGTTTRILYDNAGVLGEYTITGSGTVVAMQTSPAFLTNITLDGAALRHPIASNTTFFVNDILGNDSNACTAAGASACKTINGAVAKVAAIDISAKAVTVSVAAPATSYAGMSCLLPWTGLGSVTFTGDTTTPTNVVIDGGASPAMTFQSGCIANVEGFSLKSTSSNGIEAITNARVTITNKMDYGDVCASCVQMYATRGGYLEHNSTATVHATNAGNFAQGSHRGEVRFATGSVTWTANSTYNNGTIEVDSGEVVGITGVTISNGGFTITGFRFNLINNGLLQWASLTPPAATAIPGSAAGTYNYATRTISLAGITSGTVTLAAPAVAGTNTITFPAGTTDFSATSGIVQQATAGAAFTVSTTLPAITLGGTVSGGGNHINNVIIGTTTPLAGSFTTLTVGASGLTPATFSADNFTYLTIAGLQNSSITGLSFVLKDGSGSSQIGYIFTSGGTTPNFQFMAPGSTNGIILMGRNNGSGSLAALETVTAGTNGAVCVSSSNEIGYNSANCIPSMSTLKNIRPKPISAKEACRIVHKLVPIWYDYKEDPDHAEQPGFTAEQVYKADRRLAIVDPVSHKPTGVRYEQMSALFVACIDRLAQNLDEPRRKRIK